MQVRACRKCALHQTRTHTVFGVGRADADCMFIGEAPGAEEDARGEPFVGRAGKLLDAMLAAIGLQTRRRLHCQHRQVPAAAQTATPTPTRSWPARGT